MSARRQPARCPACGERLRVTRLECPGCSSELTGDFEACPICSLPAEPRRILDLFLRARGNLREVQRALGLSYPTTRQRVEEMFRQLLGPDEPASPREILARLRAGEIDVGEAERLLRDS